MVRALFMLYNNITYLLREIEMKKLQSLTDFIIFEYEIETTIGNWTYGREITGGLATETLWLIVKQVDAF